MEPAGQGDGVEPGVRPSHRATKAEWVAYAVNADRGPEQSNLEHVDSLKHDALIEFSS